MTSSNKLPSVKVRDNRALNGGFDWKEEIVLPLWIWLFIMFFKWWGRHRVFTAVFIVTILSLFNYGFSFIVLIYMGLAMLGAIAIAYSWVYARYDYSPNLKRLSYALIRRRIIKKKWERALRAAGFKNIPKLRGIRYSPNGINGYVATDKGQNSTELAAGALDVAAVLKAQDFRVDDNTPFEARVSIIWGDPTEQIIFPEDLADAYDDTDNTQVAFGLDNDHMPVNASIETSLLILGEPGSGKSNALWSFLNGLNEKGIKYELYVGDPKGGVELVDLKDAANTIEYKVDPNEIRQMAQHFYQDMQERLAWMEENKIRKVTYDDETPVKILLIDELLLLDEMDQRGPFGRILSSGRAAGFILIGLSQLAQKETLGPIRDLFPQRMCFATKSPDMTDAALGEGAEKAGAKCSKISRSTPGVGYFFSQKSRNFTRFRTPKIEDEATSIIAMGNLVRLRSKQVSKKTKLKKLMSMPTAVYEFFDYSGRLRYVGITNNIERRFKQHEESKSWWHEIDQSLTEITWYPKRKKALKVEKHLITTQFPTENKQHSRLVDHGI